jgi:hypothetical protein
LAVRLAVTTIVREAPLGQPGGWLRVVDLDARRQVAMAPLPDAVHRARDLNPRGGLRGGRGLAALPDRLVVAIHDRLLVLDNDWRVADVISHRWLGGVHDIAADDDGLWLALPDNDCVLRIDWSGRPQHLWQWRTDRPLRRALGYGRLPGLERWADSRNPSAGRARIDIGHLNGVAVDGDKVLVSLGLLRPPPPLLWAMVAAMRARRLAVRAGVGRLADAALERWLASPAGRAQAAERDRVTVARGPRRGDGLPEPGPDWTWAIVELAEDAPARIVARHRAGGMPVHNVVPFDGVVAVNESSAGQVLAVDRATGAIARRVQLPGELPFPRGMMRLPDGRFLVGSQKPLALNVVDLDAERLDDRIELSDDRGESLYAVAQIPDSFEDPPTTEGPLDGGPSVLRFMSSID